MSVPQSQIDYEKANASAYNATGFIPFCIIGICLITIATILRLWSRKLQRTQWQSDDATLVVALILTIGSVLCYIIMGYHYGTGHHFYSLPVSTQVHFLKAQYAFNILYTVGYPLSRISLVLLYHRIFVQQWFRVVCWFFVCVYAGYAISTALADVWLTIPIDAYWDSDITPIHKVNEDKLYLANAFFNIITDCTLLVLPLTVVWRLHMEFWQKIALSGIFALGTLTMIASIVRLTLFFTVDGTDPTYNFTVSSFWTVAEQCLGILCPCLVTFRPLFRPAARFFTSHISSRSRKVSGGRADPTHASGGSDNVHKRDYKDFHRYIDGTVSNRDDTDLEQQSVSKLVDNQQSFLEPQSPKKSGFLPFVGNKTHRDKNSSSPPPQPSTSAPSYNGFSHSNHEMALAPPSAAAQKPTAGGAWRSNVGLAQTSPGTTNDAIALASLDPRAHAQQQQQHHDVFPGAGEDEDELTYHSTFGTKTEASAVPAAHSPPLPGDNDRERGIYPIKVKQEFKLERE